MEMLVCMKGGFKLKKHPTLFGVDENSKREPQTATKLLHCEKMEGRGSKISINLIVFHSSESLMNLITIM